MYQLQPSPVSFYPPSSTTTMRAMDYLTHPSPSSHSHSHSHSHSSEPFYPSYAQFFPPSSSASAVVTAPGPPAEELCIPPGLLYPPPPPASEIYSEEDYDLTQPSFPHSHSHQSSHSLPQVKRSPSPSPSLTMSSSSSSQKGESVSPTSPAVKKARTERGERISSKDFIPPDVSGLSKREARLVKNRAAAFLSRQRKREEFEALEIRVGELEAENSALRAGKSPSGSPSSSPSLTSTSSSLENELARLRAELATSSRRAAALESDLARVRESQSSSSLLKEEPVSPVPSHLTISSDDSSGASKEKASGLMMALLLLLAPVLGSPTEQQQHQQAHQPHFDFTSNSHSNPNLFGFDHLLQNHLSAFEPSGSVFPTTSCSSSDPLDLLYTTSAPAPTLFAPHSPSQQKKEVSLDVSLERSSEDPSKVRVKIVDPSSSSMSPHLQSLSLDNGFGSPSSDFLGLPDSYSFTQGSDKSNKKRVKISVGESGEWEVEVR